MSTSNKSRPIAFFDSGVGGLTVYSKVKRLLPNEEFIYFGDTKNMPYGEKSTSELIKFAEKIFTFFESKNAKAVVMACNTTSAAAYEPLKDKFDFKIYPIIQTCAKYLAQLPIESIGIFATPATIKSGVYNSEIQKYNNKIQISAMSCPEWVKIVEEKRENDEKTLPILEFYVKEMMKAKPDKIVFGCTHYPYLLKQLSQFVSVDKFIDPANYFAQFIKEDLETRGLIDETECHEEFFVSKDAESFKRASSMFYEVKELPKVISL